MSVTLILFLLFAHWIADFVSQDQEWALNKSKSFNALLRHTITYTIVLGLFFFPILENGLIFFILINFIMHTFTDYFTSKIVASRYEEHYLGGSIPNLGAFTIIGFDQVLHYIILFTSLQYCL